MKRTGQLSEAYEDWSGGRWGSGIELQNNSASIATMLYGYHLFMALGSSMSMCGKVGRWSANSVSRGRLWKTGCS